MEFKDVMGRIESERAEISQECVVEVIGYKNVSHTVPLKAATQENLSLVQKLKRFIKRNPLTKHIIDKMCVLMRRDMSSELEQLRWQNMELSRVRKETSRMKEEIAELTWLIEKLRKDANSTTTERIEACKQNHTRIVIMLKVFTKHDAIGNEAELMYKQLKESYECYVYAEVGDNPNVEYISLTELKNALVDNNTVIIYHHSVNWEDGMRLIDGAKCNIIFRYHNITPECFYKQYNSLHYNLCRAGKMQTLEFQKMFPQAFWLCDSKYNMDDIYLMPNAQKAVCPPFNKISEWADIIPDETVKQKLSSDSIKLLFVGRVVPNKGHLMLLDVLKYYIEKYDSDIELNIIGKTDLLLKDYNNEFNNKIESYGLSGKVNIIGEINDAQLAAYYSYSDVFLSCSEHEGFFVPAIEAQYFGLPVVALRSSAVPETLGENQLLFGDDPAEMAAAIRIICTDDEARKLVIAQGKKNYKSRFTNELISAVFEKELSRFMKYEHNDTMSEINSGNIIGVLKRAAQEERYNAVLNEVRAEINDRNIPEFPSVAFENIAVI